MTPALPQNKGILVIGALAESQGPELGDFFFEAERPGAEKFRLNARA